MYSKLFKYYMQLILLITINSQISILSPFNLVKQFNNKQIEMAYGKVGLQTNFYIRGQLYMDTMTEQHDACSPLTGLDLRKRNETLYDENYKILLTYRGSCSFAQKARNAQNAGASMLIVINLGNTPINNVIFEEESNDIYIPVALINYSDGNIIENFIKSNRGSKILAEVNFSPKKKKKFVDFKFFFSSSEPRAYDFIGNITNYLNKFGDQVIFTPYYVVHQSPYYFEGNYKNNINCLSRGAYCYFPKTSTIIREGHKILLEDLRQKCLFKLTKDKSSSIYYEYMKTFSRECINYRKIISDSCSRNTLEILGIPENYLDKCVAESFGVNDLHSSSYFDKENVILRDEYNEILRYKLTSFPAVVINDVSLTGIIKKEAIITQLCNSVQEKPDFCSYMTGYTIENKKSGPLSKKVIYFLIFLLIFVNISLFIMCRNYIIQKINDKVNSGSIDIDSRINNVINNYFALKSSSNDYRAFDNKSNNSSSQVIEMKERTVSPI